MSVETPAPHCRLSIERRTHVELQTAPEALPRIEASLAHSLTECRQLLLRR